MRLNLLAASLAALTTLAPGLAAAQSTTVPPGEARIIDKHGVCRVVENLNSDAIMIPYRDRTEWSFGANAFLAAKRDGVNTRSCDERWVDFDSQTIHYSPMTSNCAVDVQGDVWCWALDLTERNYKPTPFLGDQPPHTPTPKRVTGLPPMDTVATSGHGTACGAASGSGDVWCWGVNIAPYRRTGVTGIVEIDSAYGLYVTGDSTSENIHFYCGKKSDNTMWCWITPGYSINAYIQDRISRAPFQVANPRSGQIGAFAVANGELIWSVGPNTYVSYLRSNLNAPMRTFRLHRDPGDFVSIKSTATGVFAGRDDIGIPDTDMQGPGCGIQSDGDLYCWGGFNDDRQAENEWIKYPINKGSNGKFQTSLIAPRAGDVEHILHVHHTGFCVAYTDRRTVCDVPYYSNKNPPSIWRRNGPMDSRMDTLPQRFAKMGGDMYGSFQVTVGGFTDGTSDADQFHQHGSGFSCGMDDNGAIWCQGENNGAQLGDGTWTDRRNWTKVKF